MRDTGEALRKETASLVTALRKPQVRGSWGETQLKRVAEMAGMVERCDFDVQLHPPANDGQALRPDMRVHLAEGKYVFVDSKVPLSAFLDAAETDDEQPAHRSPHLVRQARAHPCRPALRQAVLEGRPSHPSSLAPFPPSQAFRAAVLEQNPDLYEYAIGRNVVIATPTTLIGMLRAVSYGWKQAALAETAAEVFRLGRELHERLGQMGSRFDKLGRAIRGSVNAYNETIATVEGTRARPGPAVPRPPGHGEGAWRHSPASTKPVRQIQAPELVDDAARVEPMVGRSSRKRAAGGPVRDGSAVPRRPRRVRARRG